MYSVVQSFLFQNGGSQVASKKWDLTKFSAALVQIGDESVVQFSCIFTLPGCVVKVKLGKKLLLKSGIHLTQFSVVVN